LPSACHQGFLLFFLFSILSYPKSGKFFPKTSKISWIYTIKTQISKIFPMFCWQNFVTSCQSHPLSWFAVAWFFNRLAICALCLCKFVFCLHPAQSELVAPTSRPWRMDGKWSGNSFQLDSRSPAPANHAQLLYVLPTY
jgi:hypothetical protein